MLLVKLEEMMKFIHSSTVDLFNEGISREAIKGHFEDIHLTPTEDLIDLYHWKNGLVYQNIPTGKIYFGPRGIFYPLADSVTIYTNEIKTGKYPAGFFPVLSDDTYLIDLRYNSKTHGQIFQYISYLYRPRKKVYQSVDQMIEISINCFKQGIYWYDKDGMFDWNVNA